MIPKIIHYCWLSDDPIPEKFQFFINQWKEKMPEYEFIKWNFTNFDKSSSKWVAQAFDSKKYAFAADYIRLFAIYNYGGIYMDMDIEVLKPFDDLLKSDIMIAYEKDIEEGIEAGCFGASKNNPYIGECLKYYEGREFIKQDGTYDMLPLPFIMASFLPNYENIKPLNWHYFTNKSFRNGQIEIKDYSYTIHHFAGSWVTGNLKILLNEKEWLNNHIKNKVICYCLQRLCVLKKVVKDLLHINTK